MQISTKAVRRNQSGWALAITLTFLMVTLIVFASIMYWISSNAKVTNRNNLFNTAQAAAQAATEVAISEMDRDFVYGSLNASNVYMQSVASIDQSSWPVQFTFSDTNGNANQISVSIYPQNWGTNYCSLNSQFTGLYGAVANVDVIAVATPTNQGYNMSAVVENTSQLASIPVFQFGVFYNLDLDFSPGQSLTMNGKVHCNGNIWMCPQANAYFNNVVESALLVTNHDNPNDQQNLTFNSGNVHYALAGQPVSKVDSLNLPLTGITTNNSPTNVETLFNLPPTAVAVPNDVAYNTTNQIYLYNECDLIISNSFCGTNGASVFGTNLTIFFSDLYNTYQSAGRLALITNDLQWITQVTNTIITTNVGTGKKTTNYPVNSVTNCYYSFVTNVTFYDFREQDTVQAVQIDISKFNLWVTNTVTRTNSDGSTNYVAGYPWNLQDGGTYGMGGSSFNTGDKGHPIDSIFVYNNVQTPGSSLPAVRVVNGTNLPSHWGLTIATPMPIYVLGNYNVQTNLNATTSQMSTGTTNTAWTWPAALMGDAITILSSSWSDTASAYTQAGNNLSSRNPVSTTVNAACLEGIVVSTNVASGTYAGKHYSGGLENFLRLEENWSSSTILTYNGSIVVMFPSIYATNYWIGPGTYYNVPTRNWGFDANFQYQQKSPPAVPEAKAIIRGNWTGSGK